MCTATVSGRGTFPVDGSARGEDFYVATREDISLAIRGDLEVATREDFSWPRTGATTWPQGLPAQIAGSPVVFVTDPATCASGAVPSPRR